MNQPNRQNEPIEPFVGVPRYIIERVREGDKNAKNRLTYSEYEIYIWMRLQADMQGVATVSIAGLLADLPHHQSTDNISKFVRSLRKKKYIYYAPRQGVGGSFKVHFDDWMLKGRRIKHINELFEREQLLSAGADLTKEEAEVSQNSTPVPPKLATGNKHGFTALNDVFKNPELRSRYTNTDTQKYTKADDYSTAFKEEGMRKKVATPDFEPRSPAERRCKEIAEAVGDPYIHFIIAMLKECKNDIEPIEEGYDNFLSARQNYEREGKRVENPAALFNRCVVTAVENWKYEKGIE
ncbi:MAG: hypothetical protein COU07_01785 [Candidatus Harrisonbacteria bacterium CG10_big_fil_rev_8_21_14_0_10_40_38]|uniref:Uncharacterized protein n=1 Tax=Candidatus Harrisonbacteria bacterium CG10_big_fil_rev_8_21_14_0_10_40_38 TaxID=1974583 RepID=A0A2H0UT85_9BACT|nr:MAG: hypothetical protein COU07_01785 [Candidatus Harrisonbacteria bacterium CG10_big_fil_rev_8_21_14_0_10_40_38]